MTQFIVEQSSRKLGIFLHMIVLCFITARFKVGASGVLANSSHGADFWEHLELDEEYMRSLHHKLLDEGKGIPTDTSRGFQEPPMMDKGGMPLYFEDGARSWSDWSATKEKTWTEWTGWTNCVQGYRHRYRTCRSSQCAGASSESLTCSTSSQPGPRALWSDWASWSSCDNGQQRRVRQCMCSDRKSYSNDCYGDPTESRPCDRQGSWSSWESWSLCQKGQGSASTQTRQRGCTSNSICDGYSKQFRPCTSQTTDTSTWSSWGAWSACSQGKRSRTRSCQGAYACVGLAYETSSCVNPVDREQWSTWSGWSSSGKWGSWSAWSSCNSGTQIRQRMCTTSAQCSGPSQESKSCSGPVTSSYARGYWGQWSACNGGYQIRYWTCTSSRELCGTTTSESRACSTDTRVNTQQPSWSSWSSWSAQTQRPMTQRPQPMWSQWTSWTSKDTQTRVRPSQPQWGPWSSWSPCNQGYKRRTRICRGGHCDGNAYETLACHIQVLPNHRDSGEGQDHSSEERTVHKPIEWIHKN